MSTEELTRDLLLRPYHGVIVDVIVVVIVDVVVLSKLGLKILTHSEYNESCGQLTT